MKKTKLHTNKTTLRVILTAAVLLLAAGAVTGFAAALAVPSGELIPDANLPDNTPVEDTDGSWSGDVFTPSESGYETAADLVAALNSPGHEGTAAESPAGTVKLLKDVKLGGTLKIGSTAADSFTLDLGGKVLSRDSSTGDFSVITVELGTYLTVKDTHMSSDLHYFTYHSSGAWTYIQTPDAAEKAAAKPVSAFDRTTAEDGKSVFYVEGGVITGDPGDGSSWLEGGGVYNGGTLTLNSGNIIGNTAWYGGGVENYGTFMMSGSACIAGNSVSNDGGGVYNDGEFTISGSACIIGNSASGDSGGVHNDGEFTMSGSARIVGSSATGCGGGVNLYGGTFRVSGNPVIKDNFAAGKANNVDNGDDSSYLITLADELKTGAEIHITVPASAAGEKFGEVEGTYSKPTQTDADHFVSDSTSPLLSAVLFKNEDGSYQLNWADAKQINITQPASGGTISTLPCNAAAVGNTVTLFAVPDAGYELDKWEVTPAVTFTGSNTFTMPDSAVTVTASFKREDVTVSFIMMGHGTAIPDRKVTPGSTIDRPENPSEPGYTFGGWYTEDLCINAWDFNTPVIEDMALFAKWTKKSSSKPQGSSIWLTETVTHGPTVTPTPTATPTPAPTQEVPIVKPITTQTAAPASPAPFAGILAGLGCAAVVFCLRRK